MLAVLNRSLPCLTACVLIGCPLAVADTVLTTEGKLLRGEVLRDQGGSSVVFRLDEGGTFKTIRIPRGIIASVKSESGDQSDGLGEPDDENASVLGPRDGLVWMTSTEQLQPLLRDALPPADSLGNELIVVHLNGPFRSPHVYDIGKIISFGEFAAMIAVAIERKPRVIVIRIDSPGGSVAEMDLIIERLIELQSQKESPRVVAWVQLGASAAAITAMACKEIVMFPQGRIGSATMILPNGEAAPEPENAAEQKIAAMREARRKQVATLTGRPMEIQAAMESPEHQFWCHPLKGFRLTRPMESGWEPHDTDEDKPLALDANTAFELGVAEGIAATVPELIGVLGLNQEISVVEIDLASARMQELLEPARRAADEGNLACLAYKKRIKKEIDDLHVAILAAGGIQRAERGYTNEDYFNLKRVVSKCQAPSLDVKTRKYLLETNPTMLAHCEENIRQAHRVIARASTAIANARNTSNMPIGAIIDDLEYARFSLIEAMIPPK